MDIINKVNFLIKRPSVVLVAGKGYLSASEAILRVLKEEMGGRKASEVKIPWAKGRKEIIVLPMPEIGAEEGEIINFLLKYSRKPILVLTHLGIIPPEKESFFGKNPENFKEMASLVKEKGGLVLNYDDGAVRGIKESIKVRSLSFGFQKRSDVRGSDINMDLEGTNLKINYQNYIVPLWLENAFGKEQIYAALAAVSVALLEGMNLVRASQILREYRPVSGGIRAIGGIKNSWIINNTDAGLSSLKEAILILSKIGEGKRKVAVLGDILDVEGDPASAHEELGRDVAKTCDLLFAVGSRANFLAKGAIESGMEKAYHFYDMSQAKKEIQKEMKENDLVLVASSREMPMEDILEEIRFIKP